MSDEPEAKPTKAPHLKAYHWRKGQSGNPGGLSKDLKPIIKLAQEASPAALRTLKEIMLDKDARPNARVAAAIHILDRGFGKPKETVDANVKMSLEELVLASYKRGERLTEVPVIDVTPVEPPQSSLAELVERSYRPAAPQVSYAPTVPDKPQPKPEFIDPPSRELEVIKAQPGVSLDALVIGSRTAPPQSREPSPAREAFERWQAEEQRWDDDSAVFRPRRPGL